MSEKFVRRKMLCIVVVW